jgi:hypothetical protein
MNCENPKDKKGPGGIDAHPPSPISAPIWIQYLMQRWIRIEEDLELKESSKSAA